MFSSLKKLFYFPVASYFAFFARIKLNRWNPKVIVITGSTGKTTVLHLIQAQLGTEAYYSLHANSAFGVPFNILGLERKTLSKWEWPLLFFQAPLRAFSTFPTQKLYFVEVDTDRPGEGAFLGKLLKPHTTLWISSSRTHSANFDVCVGQGWCTTVEAAIAHEYAFLPQNTRETVYYNADNPLIMQYMQHVSAQVKPIKMDSTFTHTVFKSKTDFKIGDTTYTFNYLLPKELYYGLRMTIDVVTALGFPIDPTFSRLSLPPSRNSLFEGIKDTTIIDSTYNANLSSMTAILSLFAQYPAHNKWLIIGGMLEQGKSEQEEHEKLAELIPPIAPKKVILMGEKAAEYLYPKLKVALDGKSEIIKFPTQKLVLDYIMENIKGGETLLFKGGTLMEGVIEHLLVNKDDAPKLCRREKVWVDRRKNAGL